MKFEMKKPILSVRIAMRKLRVTMQRTKNMFRYAMRKTWHDRS